MAICFLFSIKNHQDWDDNTTYFYDGEINTFAEVPYQAQSELEKRYRETAGREIIKYEWDFNLDQTLQQLFATLQPKPYRMSEQMSLLSELVTKYIDNYDNPLFYKALTHQIVWDRPGMDRGEIGLTIPGQTFKVEEVKKNYCGYDWARVTLDGQPGWVVMSSLEGDEYGIRIKKEKGEFVDTARVSKEAFLAYVRTLEGKAVDQDGVYGAQCVDLITHVQNKFWGFWGQGNAVDFANNAMPEGWKRGSVTQMGVESGDILVWRWGDSDPYGHIGIVLHAFGPGNYQTLEQNVDGTMGGPARVKTRDNSNIISVIRPNFNEENKAAITPQESNNVSPSANAAKAHGGDWPRVWNETGVFTVTTNQRINVRRAPNTSGEIVAQYTKGQSVRYDRVSMDKDGYVWISYVGVTSGKRNWIATGPTKGGKRTAERWGTFSA